jgi:hypothetical protein
MGDFSKRWKGLSPGTAQFGSRAETTPTVHHQIQAKILDIVGRRKGLLLQHEDRKISWSLKQITLLVGEWLFFWLNFWGKFAMSLTRRRAKPSPDRCRTLRDNSIQTTARGAA